MLLVQKRQIPRHRAAISLQIRSASVLVCRPSSYEKHHDPKDHNASIATSNVFEVADSAGEKSKDRQPSMMDLENRVPMEADEPDIPLETLTSTRAPKDLVYLGPTIRLRTKERQDKNSITHLHHGS